MKWDFLGGTVVKNLLANRRHGFNSWVRKIPWQKAWQPTLVFLPGKSHGQRSLVGYSSWGHKELETTEGWSRHTRTHTQSAFSEAFDKVTKILFLECMKIFITKERKEKKEKSNLDTST